MKFVSKSLGYILVLSLILLAAGCSSKTNSETTSTTTAAQLSGEISASERPDRLPDLEGKVKQIRGNEITILKIIRTTPELTEEEKAKRRQLMQSLSPEERAQKQAEMFKVTNEAQEITIPVGVPVISNQAAGGKVITESVSLADLRQGNMLRLWFAEGNTKEIIYAQVVRSGQ